MATQSQTQDEFVIDPEEQALNRARGQLMALIDKLDVIRREARDAATEWETFEGEVDAQGPLATLIGDLDALCERAQEAVDGWTDGLEDFDARSRNDVRSKGQHIEDDPGAR